MSWDKVAYNLALYQTLNPINIAFMNLYSFNIGINISHFFWISSQVSWEMEIVLLFSNRSCPRMTLYELGSKLVNSCVCLFFVFHVSFPLYPFPGDATDRRMRLTWSQPSKAHYSLWWGRGFWVWEALLPLLGFDVEIHLCTLIPGILLINPFW